MIPSLLLDAVATYRFTKLATDDVITQPVRDTIVEAAYVRQLGEDDAYDRKATTHPDDTWSQLAIEDPDAPKLATLVTCRWCAGWWVAVLVVAARHRCPRVWQPVAEIAACSAAGALLARLED